MTTCSKPWSWRISSCTSVLPDVTIDTDKRFCDLQVIRFQFHRLPWFQDFPKFFWTSFGAIFFPNQTLGYAHRKLHLKIFTGFRVTNRLVQNLFWLPAIFLQQVEMPFSMHKLAYSIGATFKAERGVRLQTNENCAPFRMIMRRKIGRFEENRSRLVWNADLLHRKTPAIQSPAFRILDHQFAAGGASIFFIPKFWKPFLLDFSNNDFFPLENMKLHRKHEAAAPRSM